MGRATVSYNSGGRIDVDYRVSQAPGSGAVDTRHVGNLHTTLAKPVAILCQPWGSGAGKGEKRYLEGYVKHFCMVSGCLSG